MIYDILESLLGGALGDVLLPTDPAVQEALLFTSESQNEKDDASFDEVGFNTRHMDGTRSDPYGAVVQNLVFQSKDSTERAANSSGLEIPAFHMQDWPTGSPSTGNYCCILYLDRVSSTQANNQNPIQTAQHFDSITVTPNGHAAVTFQYSDFTVKSIGVVDEDPSASTDAALKLVVVVPNGPITTRTQMTAFNTALLSGQASLTVNGTG